MIAPPAFLVNALAPWNEFYSHSPTAQTIVQFLHIGGLLFAGGLAIAFDRGSLRAMRTPVELSKQTMERMGTSVLERVATASRMTHLEELAAVHRWVTSGLAIVLVSGVLLLTADIEAFLGSWVYWIKMVLVIALLVNGRQMNQIEHQLREDPSEESPAWGRLQRVAIRSLALWFTITLAGIALVNAA
jgi:hypothetical protein